jgi:hypothetical protein
VIKVTSSANFNRSRNDIIPSFVSSNKLEYFDEQIQGCKFCFELSCSMLRAIFIPRSNFEHELWIESLKSYVINLDLWKRYELVEKLGEGA